MRHYEIVFLIHPDQSEQVPAMVERYRNMVERDNGTVHRSEDWGRRQLAYPIQRLHKAHYYLMNIECNVKPLEEIKEAFKFNDAILRHIVVKQKHAITEESQLIKKDDKKPVDKKVEKKVEDKIDDKEEAKTSGEEE